MYIHILRDHQIIACERKHIPIDIKCECWILLKESLYSSVFLVLSALILNAGVRVNTTGGDPIANDGV